MKKGRLLKSLPFLFVHAGANSLMSDPKLPPIPDLIEKLRAEMLDGHWADLKDHAERGAVFYIAPDLDLAEVAARIAHDDTAAIGKWIERQALARPTPHQLEAWDSDPTRSFKFLIVQPYVVMQDPGH